MCLVILHENHEEAWLYYIGAAWGMLYLGLLTGR